MYRTNYKTRHYFNNILFTPWPFIASICFLDVTLLSILLLNKYYLINTNVSMCTLFLFIYCFFWSVSAWALEILEESYIGRYTNKVRSALFFGFSLFLVSETVLFSSFFWVYFDRIFHLSYATGFSSVPRGVELIRWYAEPLYATIVLLCSAWSANYSYYTFKRNTIFSLQEAYEYSLCTVLLGCLFLCIQYSEYQHLGFTMADSVYCSIFFLLTGFHGVHVIIGLILLISQYLVKLWYVDNRTQCLSFSVLYWHFVDIVWVFLFVFVYVYGNYDYMNIVDTLICLEDDVVSCDIDETFVCCKK